VRIKVDEELVEIVKKIDAESKTSSEWGELESDDMFQSEHYVGGYDADEGAFCFSFYDESKNEFWFQFTLDEAEQILSGDLSEIDLRQPN